MDVRSRITASTLEFVDWIHGDGARTRDDVASAFGTLLTHLGVPGNFMFLGQRPNASGYFVKMTSMPPDFVRQYSSRGLIKMTYASTSFRDAPAWRDETRETIVLDPDAPFGVSPAFVIPLHRLSGATDFVAIGTTRQFLQGDAERGVYLAAIYAASALNSPAASERRWAKPVARRVD
jgi:hypothetical protein